MERRLAAIMAADMVGYGRLVAADETGTILRHKSHRRELIDPKIAEHEGRVFKTTGDGFLAEFPSVLRAVLCGAEIQRELSAAEANLPEESRMRYRIGINLGDVLVDQGDVFGDGVNLAARLEQLADSGGVCVSDIVYRNVRSKLDLRFEPLGPRAVKSLPDKIQAYRLVLPAGDPAMIASAANADRLELPAKPSIAVLPFANMSSDPEQDFFADGMTEDLITALSRVRELFVISRNSSFVYKGLSVRLEDVARTLGVRFLLEGSIRVAGKRVRVTAQLIDGVSGDHVWAERYDGDLSDIFSVQDEITRSIALALQVKLTYGELARLWEGKTQNLRAWEKMVLARDLFLRFNPADNREARRVLEEALAIDPNYTGAMVQLGLCHWWDARFNSSVDKELSLNLTEELAEKVIAANPGIGNGYMLKGGVAFLRDQHDVALSLCRKAIDLSPGDSWAQAYLGLVSVYAGEPERALGALKTAMRLSPHCPTWYLYNLVLANLWSGNLTAAQETAEAYLLQEPDDPYAYTLLATVYGMQERQDEATGVIAQLRERHPNLGMKEIILSQRYKERDKLDRVINVLRRAGLPD